MIQSRSKLCKECLLSKSLNEFYTHKRMKDGHLNYCIACVCKRVKIHRSINLESIQEYDRQRSKTALRKEKARQYSQTSNIRDPEKRKARIMVGNAIRDGRLIKQPCFICGNTEVEAHHPDYSRPLDVTWLCSPHHNEIHSKYEQLRTATADLPDQK